MSILPNYLVLDVETTAGLTKGNPFSNGNKLCYTGFGTGRVYSIINHLDAGYDTKAIQEALDSTHFLVGFNLRFDCHWLENIGLDLSRIRLFDCQYAAFLFSSQQQKYPSLEGTSASYGLDGKLDVVKDEYWSKGVDTVDIPTEIMVQYLEQDLLTTEEVFLKQWELFQTTEKSKWRLFQLHMEDSHCLREMERNGILYDTEKSLQLAQECEEQLASIGREFDLPNWFNFGSGDHLSCFLYGGVVSIDTHVPIGVYKTGAKVGQTMYKIVTHQYEFPRQFEPIKNSELKKDGYYATDAETIGKLKGTRETKNLLSLLDKRAKLEKLRGTYYAGFPKKLAEMAWRDNYLHPSLNSVVAITGRLSSSNPNGQNQPTESKVLCLSRFT